MYGSVLLITFGLFIFIGPYALIVGIILLILVAAMKSRSADIDKQFGSHVMQYNAFIQQRFPGIRLEPINSGRSDVTGDDYFIVVPVGLREAEKGEFRSFIENELSNHVRNCQLANIPIKINDEVIRARLTMYLPSRQGW